ncbi:MAG: class I SAM-dependent methyltransferase [Verrucomicrobia bacterium]|nr:class I SAM-dependent methyltransferase [Verrucomicrobiota bacterium]
MNAEQYYQRNVVLHGQAGPDVAEADSSTLPARPSETDYALHWLREEGVLGSILDVGCAGLGLLLKARSFKRRCGVDIASFPAWDAHPQVEAQARNVDEGPLPFADETFDAVTCLMVVEHVFDPYHAARELRRVCKPAGRVIIGVPNLAGIKRRWELLCCRLPITSARFSFSENAWDGYHLHNFTQASLDWLLRKEGLAPTRWAAHGRFPWFKQRWPALMGNDLIVMAHRAEPQPELPFPF